MPNTIRYGELAIFARALEDSKIIAAFEANPHPVEDPDADTTDPNKLRNKLALLLADESASAGEVNLADHFNPNELGLLFDTLVEIPTASLNEIIAAETRTGRLAEDYSTSQFYNISKQLRQALAEISLTGQVRRAALLRDAKFFGTVTSYRAEARLPKLAGSPAANRPTKVFVDTSKPLAPPNRPIVQVEKFASALEILRKGSPDSIETWEAIADHLVELGLVDGDYADASVDLTDPNSELREAMATDPAGQELIKSIESTGNKPLSILTEREWGEGTRRAEEADAFVRIFAKNSKTPKILH